MTAILHRQQQKPGDVCYLHPLKSLLRPDCKQALWSCSCWKALIPSTHRVPKSRMKTWNLCLNFLPISLILARNSCLTLCRHVPHGEARLSNGPKPEVVTRTSENNLTGRICSQDGWDCLIMQIPTPIRILSLVRSKTHVCLPKTLPGTLPLYLVHFPVWPQWTPPPRFLSLFISFLGMSGVWGRA